MTTEETAFGKAVFEAAIKASVKGTLAVLADTRPYIQKLYERADLEEAGHLRLLLDRIDMALELQQ